MVYAKSNPSGVSYVTSNILDNSLAYMDHSNNYFNIHY